MNERRYGLVDTLKDVVDFAKSPEAQDSYKMAGASLYVLSRWVLGAVLHPVATFKAVMLIGDEATIKKNVEQALSLPKLPIGRERFQR